VSAFSTLVGREITHYSESVPGEPQNHDRAVCFDVTDGFVGITAYEPDGQTVADRVLLSPTQMTALRVFLGEWTRHTARPRRRS
jgi:hypothetical protein